MLKVTVAVLAIAIAGSASAGWRDLRVDASSQTAFEQSLEVFKDKLSPARREVFAQALQDIWVKGTRDARAEQREYTADEYYRQLDGLTYEEVVTFTDPTGDTAKNRYRTASLTNRYSSPASAGNLGSPSQGPRPAGGWGSSPASHAQGMQSCGCSQPNGPQGN